MVTLLETTLDNGAKLPMKLIKYYPYKNSMESFNMIRKRRMENGRYIYKKNSFVSEECALLR